MEFFTLALYDISFIAVQYSFAHCYKRECLFFGILWIQYASEIHFVFLSQEVGHMLLYGSTDYVFVS